MDNTRPPWLQIANKWVRGMFPPLSFSYGNWKEESCVILTAAKQRVEELEKKKAWVLLKKMVNPYEMVYTHEDKLFHQSIVSYKPLSRSYFKMMEMMHVLQFFELLPKQTPKIRSAHVAEGPGGFIQALVELCSRNNKILQTSTAMTLKSVEQHVPGWRRASSFLHHHPEVKLHYGNDGTGNIYIKENQDSFVSVVSPGVHIFTADGGFDFSVDYSIQEQQVFNLLISSINIGVRCLNTDGVFILKIFDIFAESTQIIIILLSRCFREWILYKPAISRPCNSERYFLGRGFKGPRCSSIPLLQDIELRLKEKMYPIFNEETSAQAEMDYIRKNIQHNTFIQVNAIERAEIYLKEPRSWYKERMPEDFKKSLEWCEKFRIPCTKTKPDDLMVERPFTS
jgi:23S rRNA U2552 (ribose-2'-O)-methylase RlmE/FtsJ